jgi:hypothetical protein
MNHADLVVGEHHRHEARIVAECAGDFLRIEPAGVRAAMRLDIQQRHVITAARQPGERIEHRFVLGRDAQQVIAAAAVALGHAADGEVIAFGGPAGENDFLGIRADAGGDRSPGRVDGIAGLMAE